MKPAGPGSGGFRVRHLAAISAARLTLASILAMAAATALSLQNPWWAAMAVWMIGQPPRGLLLERSLAQLLGTLLGAAGGLAILLAAPEAPAGALLGLAVLVAACCGLANLMQHQRAYGAALCGLTASVIVVLTVGTGIDPVRFAAARALDNVIGIGAALLVAWLSGPAPAAPGLAARARAVAAEALALVEAAIAGQETQEGQEGRFLLSLAALDASAEDAAAGSVPERRRLRAIEALFASLLDLVVIARAIRAHPESEGTAGGHAALAALRAAVTEAGGRLAAGAPLGTEGIAAASRALERAEPSLAPPLREMRDRLDEAAEHLRRATAPEPAGALRRSMPHPDAAAIGLSTLRGLLVVAAAAGAWLLLGQEEGRYLALGAAIFTVLFSAADEPAPAVRQILLGGLAASAAALLWRVAVLPAVAHGWLSLGLAVPLVYAASLLQLRRGSAFTGLAFNMLFAVLARPVDVTPTEPAAVLAAEAMLLAGIGASYVTYRWLLPMNPGRRRGHLRAAIRREVAAVATRAGTPLAGRHMARLRRLVFQMAVQARGQVRHAEDAIAALTLGHVVLRLGETLADAATPGAVRRPVRQALQVMASPLHDPAEAAAVLRDHGRAMERLSRTEGPAGTAHVAWLLHLAARDLALHRPFFAPPAAPASPGGG